MGLRGAKATPTAIRKVRGTDRADRLPKNEPKPAAGRPRCPGWLGDEAKACWRWLIPHLDQMGVLTQVDRNSLVRYCQMWSRWVAAEKSLQQYGSTYPIKAVDGTAKYIAQRPEVSIAHKLSAALSRIEAEFGMTPSSRTRIEANVDVKKIQTDERVKFFKVVG